MLLLPAIDLMDGEVVRLKRGLATEKTVYSNDPVAFAEKWEAAGADWLHLVDLDAAFSGEPRNLLHIGRICAAVTVPCELGGGMRKLEEYVRAPSMPASTGSFLAPEPASPSTSSGDGCSTSAATASPSASTPRTASSPSKAGPRPPLCAPLTSPCRAEDAGAGTIIYTDIATDGMLEGPNFSALKELLDLLHCHLIASGGVSRLEDLRRLASLPGLYGAIIGKALYEGKITTPLPSFK